MNLRLYSYLKIIDNFKKNMSHHPAYVKIVEVSPMITDIYYEDMSEYHRIRNEKSVFSELRKQKILEGLIRPDDNYRPYIKGERHVGRPRGEHYISHENYNLVKKLHNTAIEYALEHPIRGRTKEEKEHCEKLREIWHNKIQEIRNGENV